MTVNVQQIGQQIWQSSGRLVGARRYFASLIRSVGSAIAQRLTPAEPRARSSAEIMSAVERRKKQYDALWYGHYLPPSS